MHTQRFRGAGRRRLTSALAGATAATLGLSLALTATGPGLAVGAGGAATKRVPGDLTGAQAQALAAGVQVAPKGAAGKGAAGAANPYLANVPDARGVDYAGWQARISRQSAARAAKAQAARGNLPPAIVHDEEEPAGTAGANDSVANAEPVRGFGTRSGEHTRVRVQGEVADIDLDTDTAEPGAEDNGSIDLATPLDNAPNTLVSTTGVLGDGPHGSSGDGTNDFDFYEIDAAAGRTVRATTNGSETGLDTLLVLYTADGTIIASDDDSGDSLFSYLEYDVPEAGTYYLLVAGYTRNGTLPADPFDSGSGAGGADEGAYALSVGSVQVDRDYYAVRLRPGDVLGGVAQGSVDALTVYRPDGEQMIGSEFVDASSLYPPSSPLPGGGNTTVAYVAETGGWYAVAFGGATGAYDTLLEAWRPGGEIEKRPRTKQTVFLDFDGARVNAATWGGQGTADLSPFSTFLGRWGIPRAKEGLLTRLVTQEVTENLRTDAQEQSSNPNVDVQITDSRTSEDTFGDQNVSRVAVGGTVAQLGIETIGIAQYIDPGNYEAEDQAVVLLDLLSESGGEEYSLNTYMTPKSNRVRFVAQALGNVIAHEVGHLVGSYHTDNTSAAVNLMDSGGANFQNLFGVGPDGVGGTADDADVDFGTDTYSQTEPFTGLENTLNNTAWGFWYKP